MFSENRFDFSELDFPVSKFEECSLYFFVWKKKKFKIFFFLKGSVRLILCVCGHIENLGRESCV